MSDGFFSQWIFLPLWLVANAVVSLGIISMLGYGAFALLRGMRVPVSEVKSNTPNLPR